MRCLFCKECSFTSTSVEHIIPESLGNTKNVLPPGVVCDKCNNYFAREIEKPFLGSPAFNHLRFSQVLPNKRGRVPSMMGILIPGYEFNARRHLTGPFKMSLDVPPEAFNHILSTSKGTLIFPASGPLPSDSVVSRFLAKVAMEALAQRAMKVEHGLDNLIDEKQFDPLRRFARRGEPKKWPHYSRRIYNADHRWNNETNRSFQVVYEFDFLRTDHHELYFVLAIFGLELTINVGGPDIDGYVDWLKSHSVTSPLYHGKNSDLITDG